MNNSQNGPTSVATGISNTPQATDEYSTPIPQGATSAPPQQDEYSTPIPQGSTTSPTQTPQSQESSGMQELDALGNVVKGAYKSAVGSVDQTKQLIDKYLPGADNTLTQSAPQGIVNAVRPENTTPENQGEQLGANVETIGEFLLGDEAIKGLSVADKFKVAAKAMGVLEQFPKVEKALQLGINIGKAGATLGPEERALITKYPVLARLVGVGMDALRQGGVQAAQTEVHSGGNTKEALKSGAGMAVGSGVLGGVLGTAGGLLEKGGEAAKNAEGLRTVAEGAPTDTEANNALQSTVEGKVQPVIDAAQQAKDAAQEKLEGAASVVGNVTAPTKEEIASNAAAHIQGAHNALSSNYETAIGKVKSSLDGETIDYHDTPIKDTVQELLGNAEKNKEYLPSKFKAPTPLTPTTQTWLQNNLEHFGEVAEKGEDGKEKWVPQKTPVTADDLLDVAKQLKANIRKTSFITPEGRADRDAYFQLLDSVHDSLQELAYQAGKPETFDAVQAANQAYKSGVQRFNHPDVKALLDNKNENAIINTLTGKNSAADIQTIKDTIGPKAYASLADDAMTRLAADARDPQTGQVNLQTWVRNMSRIPDSVREQMLQGTTKGGALENILRQVRDVNGSGVIENSDKAIKDSEDTIKSILGNQSNLVGLLKQPEKVDALSKLVGPEAMGALGDQILHSQIRAAATDETGKIGSVNTGKVLDFISNLKDSPEVVKAFFQPTPKRAEAYDQLISKMQNVQSVKNLVKAGVILPTVTGAGLAAGAIGHSVFAGILGSIIAGGGEVAGKDFLEKVANSPRTWATLRNLSGYTAPPALTNLARIAAGKATANAVTNPLRNIYQSTQTQLGNQ
jgi:hypothetical protein